MADKNRNGIDDRLEDRKPQFGSGGAVKSSAFKPGATYSRTPYYTGILGEVGNFGLDTLRNLDNFWDSEVLGNKRPQGGGVGDFRWGSAPRKPDMGFMDGLLKSTQDLAQGALRGGGQQGGIPLGDTQLPSFMSFLEEAMGQSPVDRVSFDPQRNNARQRGTEYDARLAAMYEQLQNSMRQDGATTQQNFQGAIDDTAQRSAAAQQQIQAASNAADDRNAQVLANLGIEQAQGNIVQEGRDLNTQTADAVADAAARGQIAGDALQQNQQSAGALNTSLVGAAGLEGNLQRARVQSELASLLAQYDMQEQEANRQAQQQSFTQAMGLANAQYEDAWRQRGYEDDMSKWLFEQQQAAMTPSRPDPMQMSMNFIGQLQQQYPDLDMEQLVKLLGPAASIGKLYR